MSRRSPSDTFHPPAGAPKSGGFKLSPLLCGHHSALYSHVPLKTISNIVSKEPCLLTKLIIVDRSVPIAQQGRCKLGCPKMIFFAQLNHWSKIGSRAHNFFQRYRPINDILRTILSLQWGSSWGNFQKSISGHNY